MSKGFLDYTGLNKYTQKLLSKFVPSTRTINGKALTSNITLSASDVSARPSSWSPDLSTYAPKASPVFTGSISMGRKTGTTVGNSSVAIGGGLTASGSYSYAEGADSIASGNFSHAEGCNTEASGVTSHAEGSNTKTIGSYSHAEGSYSIAYGTTSHAEGSHTFCYASNGGHSEGSGTLAITSECAIPISSYSGNTIIIDTSSEIYSASRISKITSGMTIYIWNTYHVYSSKFVSYTIESIDTSTNTITLTNSLPTSAFTMTKIAVIPEIYNAAAAGPSHSEGQDTAALNRNAHAEGETTIAIGINSHAEGNGSRAIGTTSHAEGSGTKATGQYSHAEGDRSVASSNNSHAEGFVTKASGSDSHAECYTTLASGTASHAEGQGTISSNWASHTSGKYNKAMTDGGANNNIVGDVFVVGNGTESTDEKRSNALRLDYSGQLYLTKAYKSTGADYAEYFEWLDGNPLNEDRCGLFVTLDGSKIKVAQPGDYILGVVSGQPCIIGNADEDWLGRWEHDEFNRFVKEYLVHNEVEVTPPEDLIDPDNPEITNEALANWALTNDYTERDGHYFKMETEVVDYPTPSWRHKANPSYDASQPYIERQDRKEWDAVGMVGVLSVIDDGTCEVNGYAKVSTDGVATAAARRDTEDSWRVISRVSDRVVKVVFSIK